MNFKWWTIRRLVQLGVLVLIASPLFGMSFFHGNLASGELFGVTLTDPLAFLQATLASRYFVVSFLGSALIVMAIYFVAGGRTFCSWVCPIGLLTELNDTLRRRLGTAKSSLPLSGTRWSLLLVLTVSLLVNVPLFEIISPIGTVTRAIMFNSWFPLLLLLAIVAVETTLARRVWCRSLCPVGGFYALLGRFSPLRIGFKRERCTYCGDCLPVCPVEEVLRPSLTEGVPQVVAGDCTRCCACIDACPAKALNIDIWYK